MIKLTYFFNLLQSCWNAILSLLNAITEIDTSDDVLEFLSKVLATLLQVPIGKPFSSQETTSSVIKDHCDAMHAKLIVSSCNALLLSSNDKYQQIVKKSLQTTFSALMNSYEHVHCNKDINDIDDEDGDGNTNNKRITLQSCISECQRFLSSTSNHAALISSNETQIEKYVHSLSTFLQMCYHTYYIIASPCFATGLATILLSSAFSKSTQTILKEMVDMHSMVNDKNTQLSIENSIGLIAQRVGIESFLSHIPLSANNNDIMHIPSKQCA